MIITGFGNVRVKIDGKDYLYDQVRLKGKSKKYVVDALYRFVLPISGREIELFIDGTDSGDIEKDIETGEQLALISFIKDDYKVSLGTEGDITGIEYIYTSRGMILRIREGCLQKTLKVHVACLTDDDHEKRDIYCWLAADPNEE